MLNKDRVVIITGAGKGLGRAFALQAARDGAAVIVNNRLRDGQPDSASAVVDEIKRAGGQASVNHADVTDEGASQALVETALSAYGRLDAVIFNAGVNGPARRFEDAALDDFKDVMAVNFSAPLSLAHHAWGALKEAEAGRLLFVSSSAGLYGVRGRAPYAASKGALQSLAFTLAFEGRRDGLGVNVLAPYAATNMTAGVAPAEVERLIPPEKVASLASWLISPVCQNNGEIWVSGGGYVRKARIVESAGAVLDETRPVVDWMADASDMLDATQGEATFVGAEASFADLLSRLQLDGVGVSPERK